MSVSGRYDYVDVAGLVDCGALDLRKLFTSPEAISECRIEKISDSGESSLVRLERHGVAAYCRISVDDGKWVFGPISLCRKEAE